MAVYPISYIGTGSTVEIIKPINRAEFENNTVATRLRTTKKRYLFELTYSNMTFADFETLNTFFDTYQGTTFEFTNPITNVTHNVKFGMDRLKYSMESTYVSISGIILEEQ